MSSDVSKLPETKSIIGHGQNCWRVESAEKLALILDACSYFIMLRRVILHSKEQLLLIGWDFDLEIEMLPGESDPDGIAPDGLPNQLGPFLEAVVDRTPDLHIYMLKWNGAVVAAPGRLLPTAAIAVFGSDHIHFALDGHHPFGACHHQKIVVADDNLAFCGGIDATENRWDTPEHLPDDPRRVRKDGTASEPWHDATSAVSGPAATALGELSRQRWHRATGETLEAPKASTTSLWPEDLNVDASNIEVAIARTEPPYDGQPLINEIEQLLLSGIRAAKHSIYIESQYFAARTIIAAIEERLKEQGGPEVIVINPQAALSSFEDDAMHVLRDRAIERLDAADHESRFRIFYPVTTAEQPIYVHAKIMIIDASFLLLGSANLNDRSMGFDTECSVAIEGNSQLIGEFQAQLLSEHLGVSSQTFREMVDLKTSLISTIEELNGPSGRGLRAIAKRSNNLRGELLADTRLMDPRFAPGEATSAGKGLRPRHVALVAGGIGLCYLGWVVLRRTD